jgi:hypothetical protein
METASPAPQIGYMAMAEPPCRIHPSTNTIPAMEPNPTRASLTPMLKQRRPEVLD